MKIAILLVLGCIGLIVCAVVIWKTSDLPSEKLKKKLLKESSKNSLI